MIDFVGLPPFLRTILRFAMEAFNFHKAQTIYFKDNVVLHLRGPNEQFGTHGKLVGLSIYMYFLYNITVFANIQRNVKLQQLYNGIQEKVI